MAIARNFLDSVQATLGSKTVSHPHNLTIRAPHLAEDKTRGQFRRLMRDILVGDSANKEFRRVTRSLLKSRYPNAKVVGYTNDSILISNPSGDADATKLGRSLAHYFGGTFGVTMHGPQGTV